MTGLPFAIGATVLSFYVGIAALALRRSSRKKSVAMASAALTSAWGGALYVAVVEWNVPFGGRLGAIAMLALAAFMSLPAIGAFLPLRPEIDPTTICAHCGYSLLGLRQPRCPECGTPFSARYLRPPPKPDQPQNPNDA